MKQWRESDRMKIWDEQRVGMYIQVRGSRESHGGGKWIVRLANLKKGERERERERDTTGALQQGNGKKMQKMQIMKEKKTLRCIGKSLVELSVEEGSLGISI